MKKFLTTIFALGAFAFGTANAATVTIGVDTFDVGDVDYLVAVDEMQGNSNPVTETTWVNDTLNGINPDAPTVEYTIKTEDVPYYATDVDGVYAFALEEPVPDFFLVKNSTDIALFQNNIDLSWGVFDIAEMDGFHLGDDFTISHVTQFDIDDGDRNVVPVPPAVWLFGSGLLGLVGVARRKEG
jgi:hypothetical protein